MHICFVVSEFPPVRGGIATFYSNLSRLLVAAGHRVTVLLDEQITGPAVERLDGIEIVLIGRTIRSREAQICELFDHDAGAAPRKIAYGLAARDWCRATAQRLGIDVIETIDYGGFGTFLIDNELPPLVVSCHGSMGQIGRYEPGEWNTGLQLQWGLELALVSLADAVTCCSPKNTREWENIVGREVHFATAPWVSSPGASGLTWSGVAGREDGWRGLVVGRLQSWKGAIETIEACRLCTEHGIPAAVRWIGGTTQTAPDGSDMAEYLRKHYPGIWGEAFVWEGPLDRKAVRREMARAGFVLVPSRWDTFNYTVVEAMSIGAPVIVSDGAGASYLCEDGKNALSVPAEDSSAIVGAIGRLQADRGLGRTLGKEAHRTIAEEFKEERIVSERITVYEGAIERRRRRMATFSTFSPLTPLFAQVLRIVDSAEDIAIGRMGGKRLLREALTRARFRFRRLR